MTITYQDENEQERTLTLGNGGVWSGDDAQLVGLLNFDTEDWLGGSPYFLTPWHKAKAVADKLRGVLDTPEPEVKHVKGRVY